MSEKRQSSMCKMYSAEYNARIAMISRCYNPNNLEFRNYGGRGIHVCRRWRHTANGLRNFLSDMGPRPSDKHSIDRIDNDGNYTPANCRWATCAQQATNKRTNNRITYKGETKCVSEWARIFHMTYKLLWTRLSRGWPIEKALTQKPDGDICAVRSDATPITFNGITDTIYRWSLRIGIPHNTLRQRLCCCKWSIEEALTTPLLNRFQSRKCK